MGLQNYNLKVNTNDIDFVVLKLTDCPNVEIRDIGRIIGLIRVQAETLEKISEIAEILFVEKDTRFYINRIAIL